jgi:WD40 repeat protein
MTIWNISSGREEMTWKAHKQPVDDIAFSPDGRILATGSSDGTAKLWDPVTGREVAVLRGHLLGVHSIAFSPDGQRLATGSNGKEAVKLWDIATRQEVATLEGQGFLFSIVAFSPGGKTLMAVDNEGTPHLWRAPLLADLDTVEDAKAKAR